MLAVPLALLGAPAFAQPACPAVARPAAEDGWAIASDPRVVDALA